MVLLVVVEADMVGMHALAPICFLQMAMESV